MSLYYLHNTFNLKTASTKSKTWRFSSNKEELKIVCVNAPSVTNKVLYIFISLPHTDLLCCLAETKISVYKGRVMMALAFYIMRFQSTTTNTQCGTSNSTGQLMNYLVKRTIKLHSYQYCIMSLLIVFNGFIMVLKFIFEWGD